MRDRHELYTLGGPIAGGAASASARLPSAPIEASGGALARLAAAAERQGRDFPNLYKVLANSPAGLDAWSSFASALRHGASIPETTRELVILAVALRTGAAYEWAHHCEMAEIVGVSEEKLAALAALPGRGGALSDAERAAVGLAEAVADGPVDDDTFAALRPHYDDREIVDLVLTAGFYVMAGRVLDALEVELEPGLPPSPPLPEERT